MEEKYIVIELQRNGDQIGNIVTAHDTREDAEYKFHTVAAAASISNIERHSVTLISDHGIAIKRECYEHLPIGG